MGYNGKNLIPLVFSEYFMYCMGIVKYIIAVGFPGFWCAPPGSFCHGGEHYVWFERCNIGYWHYPDCLYPIYDGIDSPGRHGHKRCRRLLSHWRH